MKEDFMNQKTEIPVVFAADRNYLAPCYLALFSAVSHQKENTSYLFYLLLPDSIKKEELACFESLKEKQQRIEIRYCFISEKDLQVNLSREEAVDHISSTTYYRFLIPELLEEHEKCIYIDVDTVIQKDLRELYETDLADCYLAGVKNVFADTRPGSSRYEKRCQELGVASLETYVNAGVLLLNLKKLREDQIQKQWLKQAAEKSYLYNDQDIINSVCYGKIWLLDYKYNVFPDYCQDAEETSRFLQADYREAAKDPVIIHYVSKEKPWISRNFFMAEFWWNYGKETDREFRKTLFNPFLKVSRKKLSRVQHLKLWIKQRTPVKMLMG